MNMKRALISLSLLLISIFAFGQFGGQAPSISQRGYCKIHQTYGLAKFIYVFDVKNGQVKWSYSEPNGNYSGQFRCNPYVEGDVITAECSGIVYWYFAAQFIDRMVEHVGYDTILYKWAMEAIDSSKNYFEKAKATSTKAYEVVKGAYENISLAKEGKWEQPFWDTLCLYSYIMSEHPLEVPDLYGYDF